MTQLQDEWALCMKKGIEFCQKNQFDLAESAFSRATKIKPESHESWLNLCTVCLALRQPENALRAAEEAAKIAPRDSLVQMMMGDAYRECGRADDAFNSYGRSVKLNRHPLALNKLACAVRENNQKQDAKILFEEALEKNPNFSVVRFNLMVTNIMLNEMVEVEKHYKLLLPNELPPKERGDVIEIGSSIGEYNRLEASLKTAKIKDSIDSLDACLLKTNSSFSTIDEDFIIRIKLIADTLNNAAVQEKMGKVQAEPSWPSDWDKIESLYMIPFLTGVDEYCDFDETSVTESKKRNDMQESLALIPVIAHARDHKERMLQPRLAEASIRFWHLLSTKDLQFIPSGHFKMWTNMVGDDALVERTNVDKVLGTIQIFFNEVYATVSPGLPRAILAYYTLSEVHPFSDGNGRVAMTWMNRELEWNGEAPAIYDREMGLRGDLRVAKQALRDDPKNIQPLIDAIRSGQKYALEFCKKLAAVKGEP